MGFNIFLTIVVCAAASLSFAWLLSVQVSAPYTCHCWKYACVVKLSVEAGSIVTLEDVAVLWLSVILL